ncbi:hypothetical protein CFP56_004811 [Quercus suber]|uniref:Uncharacterized protein n=1 Tax=Quercus suber TaxID=58331 RepID=A0AAW0M767_QUESU
MGALKRQWKADDYKLKGDLGYNGFSFAWCNRKSGIQNVWARLDRGVAFVEWILRFPTTRVHHLEAFHSDHRPIILVSDSEFKRFYRKASISGSGNPEIYRPHDVFTAMGRCWVLEDEFSYPINPNL